MSASIIRLGLPVVLYLALAIAAESQSPPAAIPFSDIGARATADYQGDALSITATSDGARLRCGFQKLEGHATPEGLWLESTEPGASGKLRLTATAIRRETTSTLSPQPSALLPATGTVSVTDKLVRFVRPGVTEEYSVSADGVQQDFVITQRPAGTGDLYMVLALRGAQAETALYGARLKLEGSGRELAYSGLRTQDATGRELKTRLEVLSINQFVVIVTDANAAYPVRIDPTFSDADWIKLNTGLLGANFPVWAVAVDDSGNLYAGGWFTFIGTVSANYIAKWDGRSWSPLSSGMNGTVFSLAISGTNLYAGGSFTLAGGVAATNIAKWDGRSWSALDGGINGEVAALAANGTNLYAGGYFTLAGGISSTNIARWDGSSWSALGGGVKISRAENLMALAVNGSNVYVGGWFKREYGAPADYLARWDGLSWSALGDGVNGSVTGLAVSGNELYACGPFDSAGGVTVNGIAKWDGIAWSALEQEPIQPPGKLTADGTNLFATVQSTAPNDGVAVKVEKWDGATWSTLGSEVASYAPAYPVSAFAASGSNVFVGGWLEVAGGARAEYIAKWDGTNWSALGEGGCVGVSALVVSRTNLYVAGRFAFSEGGPGDKIVKWDGSNWSVLGPGTDGLIAALALMGEDIYAAGMFSTAGGIAATNIAKWNGAAWSALGSGLGPSYECVYALATIGTNLYAGGSFTTAGGVAAGKIAKWDGSAWSSLGTGLSSGSSGGWLLVADVFALAANGSNLYAGGHFTLAGEVAATNVAKWNGTAWSALGDGMNGDVRALAASGTCLYAGGSFSSAGGVAAAGVAVWDGNAWSALGSGIDTYRWVYALAICGTDLYAGGDFTTAGGVAANHLARWNGNTWSVLASGLDGCVFDGSSDSGKVIALAADPMGHLFVGGNFLLAGTNLSPFVAQANVGRAPTFLTTPQSQTAETRSSVNLFVNSEGDPPAVYLWFFNDTNFIAWSAEGYLDLSDVQFSQTGTYTVVATNLFGAVTSPPILLNVIVPVERRAVPALSLFGEAGDILDLDYRDSLSPGVNWETMATTMLRDSSQFYFDLSTPLPPERFYRSWQTAGAGAKPWLDLHMVPSITLTGNAGDTLRVDCINAIGPTDAWVTLDTVTLTNTTQLYFDVSSIGQPRRLYRIVPVP